VGRKNTN